MSEVEAILLVGIVLSLLISSGIAMLVPKGKYGGNDNSTFLSLFVLAWLFGLIIFALVKLLKSIF